MDHRRVLPFPRRQVNISARDSDAALQLRILQRSNLRNRKEFKR
jgi:hypothetical protein